MDRSAILHNLYVLATLSYLPSIAIFIGNLIQQHNLIIRAPNLKINYSFARWTLEDKYAASIWLGTFSFILLAALKHAFRGVDVVTLSTGPILLTFAGTVALSSEHFKLAEKYAAHSKTITTLFALSAIAVGYFANTVTNASIAEYTHTNAANFPDAQKVITTLATIAVWMYIAIIASVAAYFLLAIITFFQMVTNDRRLTKENRYKRCLVGAPPKRVNPRNKEMIILVSLLMGASMTASAPLAYFQLLKISRVETIVKDLLVETSFQLSPALCGVQTPTGSKMSLLPFRQAAIAIPDSGQAYRFLVIECARTFDKLPKAAERNTPVLERESAKAT